MEGLTDAHNDQYLIVPNKPLEWTGHHQLSATQPQVLCLPLSGSVRRIRQGGGASPVHVANSCC
jgi:hypothetical protein